MNISRTVFPGTTEVIRYGTSNEVSAENTGMRFYYNELDFTASVSGYNPGIDSAVIIPAKVLYEGNLYDVTSISYNAFHECEKLTSVEIPNTVTEIEIYAFSRCIGLTSIEIPNSVVSIVKYAFDGCTNLKTARVPKDCEIDSLAFPETTEIIRY